MIKTLCFSIVLLTIGLMFASCGKTPNKQSAGNLSGSMDEAYKYAQSQFGDNVTLALKGDINANKKDDALAIVINKQFDTNRYWIQRGSVIEKDGDGWKTILWLDSKLRSTKGDLLPQVDAKNGYIVKFDTASSPVNLYISMADENGRPASDEAVIKWNSSESVYEISTNQ